jgi:excinuclease ABC subunit B
MAPNKTLASQLYQEYKAFFPENKVEYTVSYYDYYQPEAYLPDKGQYIEKDLDINEQIQRYRLSTIKSLLTRNDVIVVASVSCIFGMTDPSKRKYSFVEIRSGEKISIKELSLKLVKILYKRNDSEVKPGLFRVKGDSVIIYPAEEEAGYKVMFFGDEIESIFQINAVTGQTIKKVTEFVLFPAFEYIVDREELDTIIKEIKKDMADEVQIFKDQQKYAEAQRLEQRTNFDMEILAEFGSCKGIENYSRYFDHRDIGEPPYTLMNYFPKDFLLVMDESHIGVPQIHGMIGGDVSRKKNLIDYGFRTKAAYDNRPLKFEEWEERINQVVFTSATPGEYEISHSNTIAEQIIRPTGLIDPFVEIRKTSNQIDDLLNEIKITIKRNERVLITTLTKKLAENISEYYAERGIKITYLHSDIDTLERSDILRDLRNGKNDVVIGINLLREGLDLPEVSLVAILDADKEGFLRDTRSLIQTIGRASRNVNGHVIMYADKITKSIESAIRETDRRRLKQKKYNQDHGIIPQTIKKDIAESMSIEELEKEAQEHTFKLSIEQRIENETNIETVLEFLETEMREAAENLEFERAAYIRDKIKAIKLKK